MLSQADQDIVTRDRGIPGLELVLDRQLLSASLGVNLREQAYINYKPGTSCVASVMDVAGNACAVMAYPRGRFDEVSARLEWIDRAASATFLHDVCVAVVPMSLDRRITAAGKFGDPVNKSRFLRKLFKRTTLDKPMDTVLLRYKPKRRIVSRLHAGGYPRALIKCFDPRDFNNALLGAQVCAQVTGVAQMAVDHRRHTLATAWIKGPSLCPALSGELRCESFRDTGQWLAKFHESSPDVALPLYRETPGSLSSPVLGIAEDFIHLAPQLCARLQPLVSQVNEICRSASTKATLIHGDFSADQVILAESAGPDGALRKGSPVVVDWDRVMVGSALRDVGSLLARLDHLSLQGSIEPSVARYASQAFVHGYREHLPDTDPRLVTAFHARALLLLLTDGFRHRHSNWLVQAEALLDRLEALMKPRSVSKASAPSSGSSAILTAALDIEQMQEPLAKQIAPDSESLVLQSAQLLRHKPGRRALILYDAELVSCQQVSRRVSVLGKLHYRRPDLQTPALHDLLRANGLDASNHQGVGVPASLGVYPAANIWFQELVPGKTLACYLEADGDTKPFRQAGRALACFHATPVNSFREWSIADEAGVLERALGQAARARPRLAERIRTLCDLSMRLFASLPGVASRLIHRDFYQDQVLIEGERVWIIDLDLSAQGDPAIDVANFLAHLKEYSLRRYGDMMALESLARAFREGYDPQGIELDSHRVRLLELLSLARHLHISTLFDERLHTTELLLEYCEQQSAIAAAGCCSALHNSSLGPELQVPSSTGTRAITLISN